jgi:hypothetical protein
MPHGNAIFSSLQFPITKESKMSPAEAGTDGPAAAYLHLLPPPWQPLY